MKKPSASCALSCPVIGGPAAGQMVECDGPVMEVPVWDNNSRRYHADYDIKDDMYVTKFRYRRVEVVIDRRPRKLWVPDEWFNHADPPMTSRIFDELWAGYSAYETAEA